MIIRSAEVNIDSAVNRSSSSNMIGMRHGNERIIPCRIDAYAQKGKILNAWCMAYPTGKGKPDMVYFDNKPCPKFKAWEDLLQYELQIKN